MISQDDFSEYYDYNHEEIYDKEYYHKIKKSKKELMIIYTKLLPFNIHTGNKYFYRNIDKFELIVDDFAEIISEYYSEIPAKFIRIIVSFIIQNNDHKEFNNYKKLFKTILENGYDVNHPLKFEAYRYTSIQIAMEVRNWKAVDIILNYNPYLNVQFNAMIPSTVSKQIKKISEEYFIFNGYDERKKMKKIIEKIRLIKANQNK
jgi:hypothetical protein